jgi:hypothetical protein
MFHEWADVAYMMHAGNLTELPVGIRHQGELSSRPGIAAGAPKAEEETMEQIAQALCQICFVDGWEERYRAGWNKLLVSSWGKAYLKHCMHSSIFLRHAWMAATP